MAASFSADWCAVSVVVVVVVVVGAVVSFVGCWSCAPWFWLGIGVDCCWFWFPSFFFLNIGNANKLVGRGDGDRMLFRTGFEGSVGVVGPCVLIGGRAAARLANKIKHVRNLSMCISYIMMIIMIIIIIIIIIVQESPISRSFIRLIKKKYTQEL
jgi:hypothetical protein